MTVFAVCVALIWSVYAIEGLRVTSSTLAACGDLDFGAASEGDGSVYAPLAEPVFAPAAERARAPPGPSMASPYGRR
ncbi:hypothetical protein [Yinghuangia sp. YIM S09857]|uniref:hypothetical protein n=1 Tax=Yinghuangia sp. YIM S09857 TaxID=3436929 RepID=UPI003F532764